MSHDSTAEPIPPSADPPRLHEHQAPATEKELEIEIYDARPNLQDVTPELAEVFPCK
jgi:hypothetical protein